jgi:hypothetical protein
MAALALRLRVRLSNALCSASISLEDRGHLVASERVGRLRSAIDTWTCRLLGHPRVVYGPVRDICIDCLTIVDEHPQGRGRE